MLLASAGRPAVHLLPGWPERVLRDMRGRDALHYGIYSTYQLLLGVALDVICAAAGSAAKPQSGVTLSQKAIFT